MGWRERVLQRIEECGYRTRNELCNKAGMSAGSLNMALAGTHDLKMATLKKLAIALDTTAKWILFGDEVVEASRVPLLEEPIAVSHFWLGTLDTTAYADPEMMEVGAKLRVSDKAFAWRHTTTDMEPVFHRGDILIIEPANAFSGQQIDSVLYGLAGRVIPPEDSGDFMEFYDSFFVRKLSYIANKAYFESTQPHLYSPVLRDDSLLYHYDSSDSARLVGVVVQRITTYHNPEILP